MQPSLVCRAHCIDSLHQISYSLGIHPHQPFMQTAYIARQRLRLPYTTRTITITPICAQLSRPVTAESPTIASADSTDDDESGAESAPLGIGVSCTQYHCQHHLESTCRTQTTSSSTELASAAHSKTCQQTMAHQRGLFGD